MTAEAARRSADPRHAWECRVANAYRLPVSVVKGWEWPDLVAAVADLVNEQNRCGGCGLTADDAWVVAAELSRCATCADRDTKRKEIPAEHPEGWRVGFVPVLDQLGVHVDSSAARNTPDGMLARKKVIAEHRQPDS